MHHKITTAVLLCVSWQSIAFAQTAAPPPRPGDSLPLPTAPPVDDPLLAPVPPPGRFVASWEEALADLHARSTDLRIALDQVLEAEAQTRVALARYLPTVAGLGSYTRQLITRRTSVPVQALGPDGVVTTTLVPVQDRFAGSVQAVQTVFDLAALDQIGTDRRVEAASRLSVDDKRRVLILSLANQVAAVVTAEQTAAINRQGLRAALEQQELARRMNSLGGSTALDVVRAEQNADRARATLVTGDEALRQAREALGLALGFPQETGVAPGLTVDGIAAVALRSCAPVESVDDRPDVAAARGSLEVAKRNLRNVWLTFLPTVTATSTLNVTSVVPNEYPNPTWNVQGLLSVPIWDGGVRYGNLRNARAAEDVAAEELEAVRRQALIEVEQARRQLGVAGEASRVAHHQRDLAARNDKLTQAAYVAGQATSLELVTASQAHREADVDAALKDFDVVKSRLVAVFALATCAR